MKGDGIVTMTNITFPWSYVTHINGLPFCLQSKLDNRAILNRVIADVFQRNSNILLKLLGIKGETG